MGASGYWADNYIEKGCSIQEAIQLIKPGQRVFIGSSCGAPQSLVREFAEASDRYTDVEVVRLLALESTPLTLIANKAKNHSLNIRRAVNIRKIETGPSYKRIGPSKVTGRGLLGEVIWI